jgi:hypothetical protein
MSDFLMDSAILAADSGEAARAVVCLCSATKKRLALGEWRPEADRVSGASAAIVESTRQSSARAKRLGLGWLHAEHVVEQLSCLHTNVTQLLLAAHSSCSRQFDDVRINSYLKTPRLKSLIEEKSHCNLIFTQHATHLSAFDLHLVL